MHKQTGNWYTNLIWKIETAQMGVSRLASKVRMNAVIEIYWILMIGKLINISHWLNLWLAFVVESLFIGSHSEFDFYTGINSQIGDALDIGNEANEVDNTLVDSHFEAIPSLGTLTTRWLSDSDYESLGWHSDGSLDLYLFSLLGSRDDFSSSLLNGFLVLAGKCDSNLDLLHFILTLLGFLSNIHF
jgi:hypothetical protein